MLIFREGLKEELIRICKEALPNKAFGLLVGKNDDYVDEIVPCKTNIRASDPVVNSIFESYGEFYWDKDRGFCISAEEQAEIFSDLKRREKELIAIYHSHRCRTAFPSQVDLDLHFDEKVFIVIVSLIEPERPEVKAFKKKKSAYEEVAIEVSD